MSASAKPGFASTKETYIAAFTLVAIALHITLKSVLHFPALTYNLPLFAALLVGAITRASPKYMREKFRKKKWPS